MHKPIEFMTFEEANALFSYEPETGLMRVRSTGAVIGGQNGTQRGYRQIQCNGMSIKMHRLAWLLMTGRWPSGEIDHIDGKRSNNIWSNLRDVSHSQNQLNQNYHRDGRSRSEIIRRGREHVREAIARIEKKKGGQS